MPIKLTFEYRFYDRMHDLGRMSKGIGDEMGWGPRKQLDAVCNMPVDNLRKMCTAELEREPWNE